MKPAAILVLSVLALASAVAGVAVLWGLGYALLASCPAFAVLAWQVEKT